ncbi:MAG: conjugative transposon protein TraM [Cyclobacteriaceae bacterium]
MEKGNEITKGTPRQMQQKLMLVIPLPMVVLITAFFFILGGGKVNSHKLDRADTDHTHLSTHIPEPSLVDEAGDKVRAYVFANKKKKERSSQERLDPALQAFYAQDSTQRPEEEDSFFSKLRSPNTLMFKTQDETLELQGADEAAGAEARFKDANRKLDKSLRTIEQKRTPSTRPRAAASNPTITTPTSADEGTSEELAAALQGQQTALMASNEPQDLYATQEDETFDNIKDVLKQIQYIQNPELRQRELREQSRAQDANRKFLLAGSDDQTPITYLGQPSDAVYQVALDRYQRAKLDTTYRVVPLQVASGFNGLSKPMHDEQSLGLSASIHGTQKVTQGSTVKLRINQAIYVGGHRLPAMSFVYGKVDLNGGRIDISISNIERDQRILPVQMSVYDLDGMEGIAVEGLEVSEAAREAYGNAASGMQLSMGDPGLVSQAVNQGFRSVTNLVRRNSQLPKVILKAEHKFLILNVNH